MKFVLADIRNKKICGLYGGMNEKYCDIYNYIGSADFHNRGHKFDKIEDAIKVKNALTGNGVICPNFEIIVVDTDEEGKTE